MTQIIICLIVVIISLITSFYLNGHDVRLLNIASVLAIIPTIAALVLELVGTTYSALIAAMPRHPALSIAMLLVIAVLPTLTGLLIDKPLALTSYRRRMTEAGRPIDLEALTREDIYNIVEYGDPDASQFHISKEAGETSVRAMYGRFNCRPRFVAKSLLVNVLGMLCVACFVLLAAALPGFDVLVGETYATACDFFEIIASVALLVTFIHVFSQQSASLPKEKHDFTENPDNYLLNRMHSLFNSIHLVVTLTLGATFCVWVVIFGIVNRGAVTLPWQFLLLVLVGIAYLYVSTHDGAEGDFARLTSANWGNGPLLLAIVAVAVSFLFQLSWVHIVLAVELLVGVLLWHRSRPPKHKLGAADFMVVFLALGVIACLVVFALVGVVG